MFKSLFQHRGIRFEIVRFVGRRRIAVRSGQEQGKRHGPPAVGARRFNRLDHKTLKQGMIGEKWLAITASRDGWDTKVEGPVLFRHGRWIYMFISSFTRDYDMGIARAEKITGPWIQQPNNPIISPRPPLTHVGHNGVFTGPDGRWWISYIMQFNGKDSPERLAYDPIWFNSDGWIETNAPTLGTQVVE